MSFEANKKAAFEHTITDLADQPNMQPNELKSYFDNNPEELRQAHNELCDALGDASAAANLGFAPTAGVPKNTVQQAIENVQEQVAAAVVGSIPSGSIDGDKLAQDVRNRLTAIETAIETEADDRAESDGLEAAMRQSRDNSLQLQINTLSLGKSEVACGFFTGDDAASRTITLSFTPKVVFLLCHGWQMYSYGVCGGVALSDRPIIMDTTTCLAITENGFTVCYKENVSMTNSHDVEYVYVAFK
nr:hypothetical protein [uncultured Agathobaculum sp.]